MPVVDLTEDTGDFSDPQSVQPTSDVFYAAVNTDFVRQNMNPHTVNTTSLSFPQHHYPIQVSVTIPQCPFLQSCELSRNMSPGPAQEMLVPHPPSLPPPTTMATSQCTNYTTPLPQHHTTLPPPAHSSNFSYPPHLGKVFVLKFVNSIEETFELFVRNFQNQLLRSFH